MRLQKNGAWINECTAEDTLSTRQNLRRQACSDVHLQRVRGAAREKQKEHKENGDRRWWRLDSRTEMLVFLSLQFLVQKAAPVVASA